MAAGGAAADTVSQFLKEVDVTAKADAVWTSAQQIERLTKPGSSYRNLNPFEGKRAAAPVGRASEERVGRLAWSGDGGFDREQLVWLACESRLS